MRNSNLAECFDEFADVVRRIDSEDFAAPCILVVVANTGKPPPPRPIPARRRIQIRDQGLRAFRVF
jgi:hypothetical protein